MGKILTSADYAEQALDIGADQLTDDMAVTIASWWHSPGSIISQVSHRLPFIAADLVEEVDQTLRQARERGQNTPEELDQLARLGRWAGELWILSVWSSYGHTFLTEHGDEVCLTCGAHYRVEHDDPDDYHHGRYVTWDGSDPTECTRDTSMSHGQDDDHMITAHPDGGTCAHCDHDCNCLLCTG